MPPQSEFDHLNDAHQSFGIPSKEDRRADAPHGEVPLEPGTDAKVWSVTIPGATASGRNVDVATEPLLFTLIRGPFSDHDLIRNLNIQLRWHENEADDILSCWRLRI